MYENIDKMSEKIYEEMCEKFPNVNKELIKSWSKALGY